MMPIVAQELVALRECSSSEFVFSNKEGRQYDFRKAYEAAVKKAGLKDCTFHTLRHSFASHMAMAGIDIYSIQKLLGHSSTSMTQRYAHLSDNHMTRAIDVLFKRMDTYMDTKQIMDETEKSDTIATNGIAVT